MIIQKRLQRIFDSLTSRVKIEWMAHPSLETHFGSFCQGMWKNTLWVHFRCILLQGYYKLGNLKQKWKLQGKFYKFLYCAQGLHYFDVNLELFFDRNIQFQDWPVLLLVFYTGDQGLIPFVNTIYLFAFCTNFTNESMENKFFYLHFLPRCNDCNATIST